VEGTGGLRYASKETEYLRIRINITQNFEETDFHLLQNLRMAQVDMEGISEEELQQRRLVKAKAMVGWKREKLTQVFTLQVVEVLTEAMDVAEDVLRGLAVVKFADADKERVEKMVTTLRKMHRSAKDHYLKS
jgi:hypothetical protein